MAPPRGTRKKKGAQTLTQACGALLKDLERDLREAVKDEPATRAELEAEWRLAKERGRTGKTLSGWLDELLTQVGASWILSCVFVRFAEDNELVERPLISGRDQEDPAQSRLQQARDAEQAYYARFPAHAEREYLRHVFRTVAALPGMADLFDERHALLWRLAPRVEGGRELLAFFRAIDADTGKLRWDFNDPERRTRFLGDLYQDLSESARKQYALLQTPEFVEEFILDRTLEPALDTFGLEGFRMIDPTCGSGHFLLGAFERILERWRKAEPGTDARELVARALDAVNGVDVNPFAVAIASFRLHVAALNACGLERLADAPAFRVHVAVGDSLLHGPRFAETRGRQQRLDEEDPIGFVYSFEVKEELRAILGRQYHAVVGNPPYITPKDEALNAAYRDKYGSCSGKYALSVPFMERFIELAVEGRNGMPAGYVGKITANSFMKREFGKRLVEEYFPQWDLTAVIDMSGAYINPEHGTPTVLLFVRNQRPKAETVRAVLGIRGEPSTPDNPARGLVWSAIVEQVDDPGSESEYVSVEDVERSTFLAHPWSLGGGGGAELKAVIETRFTSRLGDFVEAIGFASFPGQDDAFVAPRGVLRRAGIGEDFVRPFVAGDAVRDWTIEPSEEAFAPYYSNFEAVPQNATGAGAIRRIWPVRTTLGSTTSFAGRTRAMNGDWLHTWYRWVEQRYRTPLSIAFAEIATHNHFVLDRGGKVFKQTAPVIKLPPDATEDDHYALLALLNSSTFLFWARQACHNKGARGTGGGFTSAPWEQFVVLNATRLLDAPAPPKLPDELAREIQSAATRLASCCSIESPDPEEWRATLAQLCSMQEELDWSLYAAFGLPDARLGPRSWREAPPLAPGQRAFEIVMARQMARGELSTVWFERHDSTPTSEFPPHWPDDYRSLVERRIELIENDRAIGLLERPEHKRRWNVEPFDIQLARALDQALADRIEALPPWSDAPPRPRTTNQLVELLGTDDRFLELLRLRTNDEAPDVERAVVDLVAGEHVPFLPVLSLSASGLRKRAEWEETWRLQRIEDPLLERQDALLADHFGSSPAEQRRAREHVACWKTSTKLSKEKDIDDDDLKALRALKAAWMETEDQRRAAVGGETPPVPPEYAPADFQDQRYWRLRGKLDVPKERFISYPHCSPDGDDTLLIGWAGWNHEQRAAALAQILEARRNEGWEGERLLPILLGIVELIPWLKQWHGDLGDEYEAFIEGQCVQVGATLEQVRSWKPPARTRGRGKRASKRS